MMNWQVERTDRFDEWWHKLTEKQQDDIAHGVGLLSAKGPSLGHPYSSEIKGSRHGHMRELRIQSKGKPLRIFYAFDPRRMAILLIGGDKTGQKRFYEIYVPLADRLYDEHIKQLDLEKRKKT